MASTGEALSCAASVSRPRAEGRRAASARTSHHAIALPAAGPRVCASEARALEHPRNAGSWLKPHLVQAAWSGSQKKDSYLRSQYHRIRARRGTKKAVVAVAASMLTAASHILKHGDAYRDLGPAHFDRLNKVRAVNRLVLRLSNLGYNVNLQCKEDAA
jgi:hypothetical protein